MTTRLEELEQDVGVLDEMSSRWRVLITDPLIPNTEKAELTKAADLAAQSRAYVAQLTDRTKTVIKFWVPPPPAKDGSETLEMRRRRRSVTPVDDGRA